MTNHVGITSVCGACSLFWNFLIKGTNGFDIWNHTNAHSFSNATVTTSQRCHGNKIKFPPVTFFKLNMLKLLTCMRIPFKLMDIVNLDFILWWMCLYFRYYYFLRKKSLLSTRILSFACLISFQISTTPPPPFAKWASLWHHISHHFAHFYLVLYCYCFRLNIE